jgi:hypothetical protein
MLAPITTAWVCGVWVVTADLLRQRVFGSCSRGRVGRITAIRPDFTGISDDPK